MALYNLKSEGDGFRITKFDEDLEVESSYLLTPGTCECPQWVGRGKTCRHMTMLPLMEDRANTGWFFHFDTGTWHDPLNAYGPTDFSDDAEIEAEMSSEQAEAHSKVEEMLAEGEATSDYDGAQPGSTTFEGGAAYEEHHRTNAGEGPGPSTFAAAKLPSSSASPRGEPATIKRRF